MTNATNNANETLYKITYRVKRAQFSNDYISAPTIADAIEIAHERGYDVTGVETYDFEGTDDINDEFVARTFDALQTQFVDMRRSRKFRATSSF